MIDMDERTVKTKLGTIELVFSAEGLIRLILPDYGREDKLPVTGSDPAWLQQLNTGLQAYFEGCPVGFFCPVILDDYPPFFRRVLLAASSIPYGRRRSYRWLAEQAGVPAAARAAGTAMAANRTPLVIPCHRVIRSDGTEGGFSSGEGWKRLLLDLECRESTGSDCYTKKNFTGGSGG